MSIKYVIIGNSAAAIGAVEAIRTYDPENPVTIVADEPHHTYSRPLISYLLGGLVDENRMYYRPADFYQKNQVNTMLGVRVTSVDAQANKLLFEGGGALEYDQLLIASGGKPFVPPVKGADLDGTFTFTTWNDARHIERYIEAQRVESAVVIGGGLIGLKTVEALLVRKIKVTVVELAERILSTIFDPTASQLAESILRREGVQIRAGTTVQEIVGRGSHVDHVILRDGERIDCDLLVFAIGVRPNTGFIPQNSEIKINRGICVDRHMRTTMPNVYAAGDCVEAYDMLVDADRVLAIWPLAYRQGAVAGANMAGQERPYDGGLPMNAIGVCDVPTISVGITSPPVDDPAYEVMERYDRQALTYKKLVLRGSCLVGAMFIGEIDRAGIYTGLIRDRVDVTPFKSHLMSGNFGLISLPKDYRKHLVVGEGIEV